MRSSVEKVGYASIGYACNSVCSDDVYSFDHSMVYEHVAGVAAGYDARAPPAHLRIDGRVGAICKHHHEIFAGQDDGWDGKHIELDQPIGVYIYTLEAETINGLKHKLFGEVTLLR